jgi:hypothetical protein
MNEVQEIHESETAACKFPDAVSPLFAFSGAYLMYCVGEFSDTKLMALRELRL